MTLTNTQKKTVKTKSGMTLIELTVVILVLLSLISILFVGARAWKRGSDRAGCIMNIRNVQQGMRSYSNMNNIPIGAAISNSDFIGPDLFVEAEIAATLPTCPEPTASYSAALTTVPEIGTLWMTCSAATSLNHQPAALTGW